VAPLYCGATEPAGWASRDEPKAGFSAEVETPLAPGTAEGAPAEVGTAVAEPAVEADFFSWPRRKERDETGKRARRGRTGVGWSAGALERRTEPEGGQTSAIRRASWWTSATCFEVVV
jgi:hypothetical protein